MKLVEILAKELSVWPESAYAYAQDADTRAFPWTGTPEFDGGDWIIASGSTIDSGSSKVLYFQLASDYETAVVTKEQWQAERDRQKGSGSHRFKQGDRVKVIARGETEWCRVGDIHKVRVCKTCPDGELVYVVNDDHESCWIRECNLELVVRSSDKSGEWKRHRGGKCPVPAGTKVSTRHRDGEVVDVHFQTAEYGTHKAVMDCVWAHEGSKHDIMAYKVISQPQAEEVEVRKLEGRDVRLEELMTGHRLPYEVHCGEVIHGPISMGDEVIAPAHPKWDQIDGPIKWRDTVNELDAYIEEFTREREALTNRLALEGFALLPPVVGVVSDFSGVDMSDWRNWKAGDVIQSISDYWVDITLDRQYTITATDKDGFTFFDDCGDKRELTPDSETMFEDGRITDFEFVSRP